MLLLAGLMPLVSVTPLWHHPIQTQQTGASQLPLHDSCTSWLQSLLTNCRSQVVVYTLAPTRPQRSVAHIAPVKLLQTNRMALWEQPLPPGMCH
jgi:hypothetical protein